MHQHATRGRPSSIPSLAATVDLAVFPTSVVYRRDAAQPLRQEHRLATAAHTSLTSPPTSAFCPSGTPMESREESPSDASVEIHGRRHAVVGRVSMDQIVVDTCA